MKTRKVARTKKTSALFARLTKRLRQIQLTGDVEVDAVIFAIQNVAEAAEVAYARGKGDTLDDVKANPSLIDLGDE